MKFVISGTEYDVDAIGRVTLFDLLELKKQTGLDVDTLQASLTGLEDKAGNEVLGDEASIRAICALIWLARRKAGESLSFEEACSFPLDEFSIIGDPEPEAVESADPL